MHKTVGIIVPVYNEQDNVEVLADSINNELKALNYEWHILFVDDRSTDNTLEKITELSRKNRCIKYIGLAKNSGKEAALKAGLDHTKTDCAITMDGDMQHPPSQLPKMLALWEEGYEVIYNHYCPIKIGSK